MHISLTFIKHALFFKVYDLCRPLSIHGNDNFLPQAIRKGKADKGLLDQMALEGSHQANNRFLNKAHK